MKCAVPEISWHNRDPVLSLDFQFNQNSGFYRLATGGTDTHVVIWHVKISDDGKVTIECVADLTRHTHAVNVVRFSPSGDHLASGDDEAIIWIWHCLGEKSAPDIFESREMENKENWNVLRALRGHLNDVCDLSWSPNGLQLLSGSVDNTAILWDCQKGRSIQIFSDHKGFVQGTCWDPAGHHFATLSSDRSCLVYNCKTRKVSHRIAKLTSSEGPQPRPLFHDDTLKSFCRRLSFSPDGQLLITPAGIMESTEGKPINVVHVFSRYAMNRPVLYLPTKDKYAVAVKCCPVLFELRERCQPIFNLPYRIIIAVATQDTVLLYDSQQLQPIAIVTSIHYARLTDITWSEDGKVLAASSTDGYCSFLTFSDKELGIPYKPPPTENNKVDKIQEMDVTPLDILAKEVTPPKKKIAVGTPKSEPQNKRRVSLITLFSKSSNNTAKKSEAPKETQVRKEILPEIITLDETTDMDVDLPIKELAQEPDGEDLKLVFELSQQVPENKPETAEQPDIVLETTELRNKEPEKSCSSEEAACKSESQNLTNDTPPAKQPRRVPFTTLSTPPRKKDPKL